MVLTSKLQQVKYGLFPEVETVIILAAGPSINSNYDQLNDIIIRHNHVVLACNYAFDRINKIPEYTVYIDPGSYRRNFGKNILSPNIIVGPTCVVSKKHTINRNYMCFKWNPDVQPFDVQKMIVYPDGSTGHKLSNCGLACLYLSHFFKPTRVIVAGLDGAEQDNLTYKHFNKKNKTLDPINVKRIKLKKRYLNKLLLPFLKARGIEVFKFKDSNFMGVNAPIWSD